MSCRGSREGDRGRGRRIDAGPIRIDARLSCMSNTIKNTLLLVVSLIAATLLGEPVVRFALSDITTTGNMKSWFGKRWEKESVVLNELGYRDRAIAADRGSDVYRIALVGDSFAFGQGLPVEERFGELIEAELNRAVPGKYEVLNFSNPGQATVSEIRVIEADVLPLKPDFILVQWLPNDFKDRTRPPVPLPPRLVSNPGLHRYLQACSALYFLLNSQYRAIIARTGSDRFDYTADMMQPFQEPDSAEARAAAQPMVDLLQQLNDSGTSYALVLHPLLQPNLGANYRLAPMHEMVMKLCREAGARCLDLAPAFRSLGPDFDYTTLWVNRFDAHPGARANRLVADYILQELVPCCVSGHSEVEALQLRHP